MAEQVLEHYLAAWNETDAARREALLGRCWAEGGVYSDPTVEVKGAAALSAMIGKVQQRYPGARLQRVSGVDQHHDVLRFGWRMVLADGKALPEGVDFVHIVDGRIARIAGFFGALKAA